MSSTQGHSESLMFRFLTPGAPFRWPPTVNGCGSGQRPAYISLTMTGFFRSAGLPSRRSRSSFPTASSGWPTAAKSGVARFPRRSGSSCASSRTRFSALQPPRTASMRVQSAASIPFPSRSFRCTALYLDNVPVVPGADYSGRRILDSDIALAEGITL